VPFAAAVSEHPLATHAVGEVVGHILDEIGDQPDAAIVFVTEPFAGATEDIAATIRATLRPGSLIGATASSVVGGGRENSFHEMHGTIRHPPPAVTRRTQTSGLAAERDEHLAAA